MKIIRAEFMSIRTVASLFSKCLYVSNLPQVRRGNGLEALNLSTEEFWGGGWHGISMTVVVLRSTGGIGPIVPSFSSHHTAPPWPFRLLRGCGWMRRRSGPPVRCTARSLQCPS